MKKLRAKLELTYEGDGDSTAVIGAALVVLKSTESMMTKLGITGWSLTDIAVRSARKRTAISSAWENRTHLPSQKPNLDHASLCNVRAKRWVGKQLVPVGVRTITDVEKFKKLTSPERCERCFRLLCLREGTVLVKR